MMVTPVFTIALFSYVAAAPVPEGAAVGAPLPANVAQYLVSGRTKNASILQGEVAAASTTHLTNYGGPVIARVAIQPIWYGDVKFQTDLQSFYSAVTNSRWWDVLSQYNVASGTASAGISMPEMSASLDDDTDIKPLLVNMVTTGRIVPTVNTYFPIHFAPGISITQGVQRTCVDFCAFHGTIDISSLNKGPTYLYYGVIPDQGGNCAGSCGNNPSILNNLFAMTSHELAEAATDPAIGVAHTNGPPLAWFDPKHGEVGDICEGQQSTTVGSDNVTYVIQAMWSNSANACVAS